jgi:hypothetical protein
MKMQVDVYSFGVVMWEILTGEDPYDGMHYGGVIGMHTVRSCITEGIFSSELLKTFYINVISLNKHDVVLKFSEPKRDNSTSKNCTSINTLTASSPTCHPTYTHTLTETHDSITNKF